MDKKESEDCNATSFFVYESWHVASDIEVLAVVLSVGLLSSWDSIQRRDSILSHVHHHPCCSLKAWHARFQGVHFEQHLWFYKVSKQTHKFGWSILFYILASYSDPCIFLEVNADKKYDNPRPS